MSTSLEIRLERLPKRDALARLRAAYACLERGWQMRRRAADQQTASKQKQEEVS